MFSINYPELENEDAQQDARYGRASLNIIDESRYLMAFAWVVPEEMFLFSLFPEVVSVDVVKSTNNENGHYLRCVVRPPMGKCSLSCEFSYHMKKRGYSAGYSVLHYHDCLVNQQWIKSK